MNCGVRDSNKGVLYLVKKIQAVRKLLPFFVNASAKTSVVKYCLIKSYLYDVTSGMCIMNKLVKSGTQLMMRM
jgi:hypothetical protein